MQKFFSDTTLIMLETDRGTTSNKLNFERELARFGPEPVTPQVAALSLADASAYCSRWATQHYENFAVASLLLPRSLRQDFHNIYAYCRWSDNLADEISDPQRCLMLLDWWQRELSLCWQGSPRHPVLVALQQTIKRHNLPPAPFNDLLSAFRQDQRVNRYADDPQLLDYCRRSANPVGRILLELANAATPTACTLSDHICTGLQLANFCQDIARDANQGRIYVPRTRWEKHGVDEGMLLGHQATEQLRSLLAEWVHDARQHLLAGRPLIAHVPKWLQTDIRLFVGGGLAILQAIARQGYDVWSRRPRVSRWTQFRLLCSCWLPIRGAGQ